MKTIEIEMDYVKSTKNTHVYGDCGEGQAVPTIYIKRAALSGKPKSIKVLINYEHI